MARRTMTSRELQRRLRSEGWQVVRRGPGDQVQYKHPDKPGRVSIDAGRKEIPIGTLRNIFRQAGWQW